MDGRRLERRLKGCMEEGWRGRVKRVEAGKGEEKRRKGKEGRAGKGKRMKGLESRGGEGKGEEKEG